MATVPGRLDRTIGSDTRPPALRRSLFRTSLTPRRMRALVELPSRAARDFSRRYMPSGMSTVVRMLPLCHIYGVLGNVPTVQRQALTEPEWQHYR